MVTVSKLSFLITITRRKQVAQIRGYPIYVVTGVAITPCASYAEAQLAVEKTKSDLDNANLCLERSDSDSDEEATGSCLDEVDDISTSVAEENGTAALAVKGVESEIAKNVIKRKGSYGRFDSHWFSRRGWTLEQRRSLGMSAKNSNRVPSAESRQCESSLHPVSHAPSATDSESESVEEKPRPSPSSLIPKLLKTATMLFGTSQSFYFSYDWDLTRSLSAQSNQARATERNLYERADPLFFWNWHVLKPFLDGGYDYLSLPLIQGFTGQHEFVIDSQPPQEDNWGSESVELRNLSPSRSPLSRKLNSNSGLRQSEKRLLVTLISRRSVKRPGLRFHRRGIDEEGFVANMVETEQLLSSTCWGEKDGSKIYSFLQLRGSIPLYFTQSPYSLRPIPVLCHSINANFKAFSKHMEWVANRYGELQIISLVEKKRVEKKIGECFEDTVSRYNKSQQIRQISFEWFDFHDVCRGMKFEKVSRLLETLAPKFRDFGSTVIAGDSVVKMQKGIARVNCMDCLDRTNVVQSSLARFMLEAQLKMEGFEMEEQRDQQMMWYNILWADNGDAISKQYASTAAMKGDYTRTKKRDYRGALMDAGLGLTRFYNGVINDFFSQAAIDFLVGNVTSLVFDEFEATLMTRDTAMSVAKMREQAIDMCQRQVASEDEDFISGWIMLTPQSDSSTQMEEVVLLLTNAALYLCRFDWNMDKISSFERVDLAHVIGIRAGTYVTSIRSAQQRDESRNVGLIIEYIPGKNCIKRINTRSLSSLAPKESNSAEALSEDPKDTSTGLAGLIVATLSSPISDKKIEPETKICTIPLKAPYTEDSTVKGMLRPGSLTEVQLVGTICSEIERLTINAGGGRGKNKAHEGFLVQENIISLSDAKSNASILDQLGHSLKRLVWA